MTDDVKNLVYIHYGSSRFIPELLARSNYEVDAERMATILNKPANCLWASPLGSEYGWRQWCEREDFCVSELNEYFTFKLSESANVLEIRTAEDLTQVPLCMPSNYVGRAVVDWDWVARNYDAVYVNPYHSSIWMAFNSWDVESLAVFNPECVEIVNQVIDF